MDQQQAIQLQSYKSVSFFGSKRSGSPDQPQTQHGNQDADKGNKIPIKSIQFVRHGSTSQEKPNKSEA